MPIIKKLVTPVVKQVTRAAGRVTAEITVRPIQILGRVVLRGTSVVLRATGDKAMSEKFRNMDNAWTRSTNRVTQHLAVTLSSPQQLKEDARTAFRAFTGANQLDVIDTKMSEIYAKAQAQLEASYQASLQVIASPQYRAELRLQIARAIRNDPNQIAQAEALAAKNDQIVNMANVNFQQTQSLGVLAPLAAIGGAAALMMFSH